VSCDRFVLALFGSLFLLALLFVPCTVTSSSDRSDPGSHIVIRTTHPQSVHIFLATYLSMRTHPQQGRAVRARSSQWVATMVIVAVLGVFDYVVFCRFLRRKRRAEGGSGPDSRGAGYF
jgi:hypothetical protein